MTDQRVDTTLRAWVQARGRRPAPLQLRQRVLDIPTDEPAQRRSWQLPSQLLGDRSMFSVLKLVAAGVIVALFGGFLLAGVLTMPQDGEVPPAAATEAPSPTSTEELLSGMVTEEVEPGVFRVVHDGVRDDGRRGLGRTHSVNVGYDGSVWLFGGDGLLRLGSDETHPWPEHSHWGYDFEVAPDGTMWVIGGKHEGQFASSEGLRYTDGEEWTAQRCPQGRHCRGFTVAPDGRVWASWEEDGGYRVGHLGPTGWQPLEGYARSDSGTPSKGYEHLFITDTGDIYGTELTWGWVLYRYEDGEWERFSAGYDIIDVGRDGTVWHDTDDEEDADGGLDRFADGEWARWTPDDLPAIASGFALGHEPAVHDNEFRVAPDGSLWFSLWQQGADGTDPSLCDGLARFDGLTLDRFLRGQCLNSMDIAPDGSVWLRSEGGSLYVITPEAVVATE